MQDKLTQKLESFKKTINTSESIVITGHERPDGDCVGSQFALHRLLTELGKEVAIVNPDPPPGVFDFLTEKLDFRTSPPQHSPDLALIIDCGNLERTGSLSGYLQSADRLVVMDHHRHNSIEADLRLVTTEVSSVGELVYYLYESFSCPLSADVAEALYASMLTDTGCFRHANTTAGTHRVVADLIETGGLQPYRIYSQIYERERLESVLLLGEVLTNLKRRDGVVYSEVPHALFDATGTSEEDLKEVINYLRQVEDSKVALLFCERKGGEIKVSFRSKTELDLLPVVSSFGGGGHSGAAGATLHGNISEVRETVLEAVIEELKKSE